MVVRACEPGSALFHALNPEEPTPFDVAALTMGLVREAEYTLRWLQWAETKGGSKGHNRPEPQRFPWESKPDNLWRGDVMTIAEAADWLGWEMQIGGGV